MRRFLQRPSSIGALLIAIIAVGSSRALATEERRPVLTPDSEAAVSALFRGDLGASHCRWSGSSIDHDHVVARFACDGRSAPTTLVLRHPSTTETPLAQTRRFAITSTDAEPPPAELVAVVRSRVEAGEQSIAWLVPSPPRFAPPRARRWWIGAGAAAAIAAAASALVVAKRRRATRA